MKKSFIFLILLLLILPIVGVEATDDFGPKTEVLTLTLTRITTGMMSYQYDERYENSDDVKWSDNMPFLGIGGRLGLNNFSVNVYGPTFRSTGVDSSIRRCYSDDSVERDHNANFSRQDYAINLSYSIDKIIQPPPQFVIGFVGYKVGKPDISGTRGIFSGKSRATDFVLTRKLQILKQKVLL